METDLLLLFHLQDMLPADASDFPVIADSLHISNEYGSVATVSIKCHQCIRGTYFFLLYDESTSMVKLK